MSSVFIPFSAKKTKIFSNMACLKTYTDKKTENPQQTNSSAAGHSVIKKYYSGTGQKRPS